VLVFSGRRSGFPLIPFFFRFFTMFLVFSLFLFLLHSKKLHPMQFPQISGLSFVFYVNTIEKLENPYFYH